MAYYGPIKMLQAEVATQNEPQSPSPSSPQTQVPQPISVHDLPERDDPPSFESKFPPLTPKEQKLQKKLQRKVDEDDRKMGIEHHPYTPPGPCPPQVVITGPVNDPAEYAEYDTGSGKIYVSRAQAKDKKTRDHVLAHETAHQKYPHTQEDASSESNCDLEAAKVIGPQKAINSMEHIKKVLGPDDPNNVPVEVAKDRDHHGTIAEREEKIHKAYPNTKVPNHKKMQNKP